MKATHMIAAWIGALVFVSGARLPAAEKTAVPDAAAVPYPEGYRAWRHVKSQVATTEHPRAASIGGLQNIYANDAALAGYREGAFPDGSVIVFDLLELQEKNGSLVPGTRRWLGVMEKNAAKYAATGGWGFDNFSGDSNTDRDVPVNGPASYCYACHLLQKDQDYVFSKMKD
jgi:hypothetical protein